MRTAITLASMLASAYSLAIPQVTTGGPFPPWPSNTTVIYYDGIMEEKMCTNACGSGMLTPSMCTPLKWDAIGVVAVPSNDCVFTLYKGSKDCEVSVNATVAATQVETWQIPAGNETSCVDVGAGSGDSVSGMWACG